MTVPPKYEVEVLSISASFCKMTTVLVRVTQKHLDGNEQKTVLIRLGAKIDLEKLFTSKLPYEPQ